jgi:hypothetical protein
MTRQDWTAYRALCKVFAYYLHEGMFDTAAEYLDSMHTILTAHAAFRDELIKVLQSELQAALEDTEK